MRDILPELERWLSSGEAVALATLVRVHGSAPRRLGARLIATRAGRLAGSVSGGCAESDVLERARSVLEDGRPALVRYAVDDGTGLDVGLSCGGSIDVLIEAFRADGAWRAACEALERRAPAALSLRLH